MELNTSSLHRDTEIRPVAAADDRQVCSAEHRGSTGEAGQQPIRRLQEVPPSPGQGEGEESLK